MEGSCDRVAAAEVEGYKGVYRHHTLAKQKEKEKEIQGGASFGFFHHLSYEKHLDWSGTRNSHKRGKGKKKKLITWIPLR